MKRSHSFRCIAACGATGEFIDVLILFFGRGPIDITVIDDELQNALKSREPSPDAVVLLSFGANADQIKHVWENNPLLAEGLYSRGGSVKIPYLKELSIWKFSDGKFEKIFRTDKSRRDYVLQLESLMIVGLSQTVDSSKAYQEAPPGHVYKHPSHRHSKHFFLASQLLSEEVDAYFTALVICTRAWDVLSCTESLHIDTMGIYPIARAIEEISGACGGRNSGWSISNFHSHASVDDLYKGIATSDVVIISASTSGGMANRLNKEGVPHAAIITILEMSDTGRAGKVIYARDKFNDKEIQKSHLKSFDEAVIELAGEYFAATAKKPRALTLTINHEPASLKSVLKHFSKKEFCQINSNRLNGEAISDLVSFNENNFVLNDDFLKWVRDEVKSKTPISVTHIISGTSEGAKSLANHCADHIASYGGRRPVVISQKDISEIAGTDCTGVLVCLPVIGDGHALRTIARDLREVAPSASRHFLVGLGVPRTEESWRRLDKFLTRSAFKDRPYLLSCWQMLPLGGIPTRNTTSPVDGLMQELELIVIDPTSPWNPAVVQESTELLGNLLEKHQGLFLPSLDNKPLLLTDGFVYWSATEEQRANCDHSAISYLAMSSALQRAREFNDPKLCLTSSLHETVVLDTENFLRFNDASLQASLLRAAAPHELNYSGASDLSELMREFLEKVFRNSTKSYGEAALEFALALATGKLALTSEDKSKLISTIAGLQTTASPLVGLLYFWWSKD